MQLLCTAHGPIVTTLASSPPLPEQVVQQLCTHVLGVLHASDKSLLTYVLAPAVDVHILEAVLRKCPELLHVATEWQPLTAQSPPMPGCRLCRIDCTDDEAKHLVCTAVCSGGHPPCDCVEVVCRIPSGAAVSPLRLAYGPCPHSVPAERYARLHTVPVPAMALEHVLAVARTADGKGVRALRQQFALLLDHVTTGSLSLAAWEELLDLRRGRAKFMECVQAHHAARHPSVTIGSLIRSAPFVPVAVHHTYGLRPLLTEADAAPARVMTPGTATAPSPVPDQAGAPAHPPSL